MSRAARRDLRLTAGDDYSHRITFVDADDVAIDLSTRAYAAQVRVDPTSATPDATFTVDDTDAATGIILISLTDAQTVALEPGAQYVWDLQETMAGDVQTILRGAVVVDQDVTR